VTISIAHLPSLLSVHGLIVALGLLVYVLTTHVMQQRRGSTAAVAWVMAIVLVPYLGLPLYLIFGTRKLAHFRNRTADAASDLHVGDAWARQLAESMGQAPVASYRELRVHADGSQALQSLWEVIDSAESELVLCTFIIGRDPMGKALIKRLIDKANAGIRVRLLLDGVGRMMGGRPDLRRLKAAGVQVTLFAPILHLSLKNRANLRNHRKMVVADGARLWCGGRNFAAEYFEGVRRRKPWKDASFDLQGPLAAQAQDLFERDWAFASDLPAPKGRQAATDAQEPFAQIIASGPDQADDTVHDLLVTACFRAQDRIMAVTPYFVPSEPLLMALTLAARRNVKVELILPKKSNHRLADLARHRALRGLVNAGGKVWQVPYMLHAKVVVVDDNLALCGSANLDARSLFLNYELMVAFYATDDVQRFASIGDAHRATAALYRARKPGLLRDFVEGFVLWLGFQL
jgi:cardiolipin synthase A/B